MHVLVLGTVPYGSAVDRADHVLARVLVVRTVRFLVYVRRTQANIPTFRHSFAAPVIPSHAMAEGQHRLE